MKKLALVPLIVLASFSASAADRVCYQLSADGVAWSRSPELVCVRIVDARTNQHEIVLQAVSMRQAPATVATFNLNLTSAPRCMDCNRNVYGIVNPSNSVFNALSVRFNGTRNPQTGQEAGELQVGETKFHYRSFR